MFNHYAWRIISKYDVKMGFYVYLKRELNRQLFCNILGFQNVELSLTVTHEL